MDRKPLQMELSPEPVSEELIEGKYRFLATGPGAAFGDAVMVMGYLTHAIKTGHLTADDRAMAMAYFRHHNMDI